MATTTTHSDHLACCRCGQRASELEGAERLVRDVATGRIYCDWCADELAQICWGEPAIIR